VVGEAQQSTAELLAQHLVLGTEVRDRTASMVVEQAGE
jgi:hypothetical protein